MGLVFRVRASLVVSLLVIAVAATAACAPAQPSPQALFDAAASKADAALRSGDAETALTLYTEALSTQGAKDIAGRVAAQQEKAKRLVVSRRILAKLEPSLDALSSYVQVLQYSAAESTEAVAARNGLADSLVPYPRDLGAEVTAMRKSIKANRSAERPTAAFLVNGLAGGWQAEVAQAPRPVGTHAAAAAKYMGAAATAINTAFGRTYATDALRDLDSASKSIAAATSELKAVRSGK